MANLINGELVQILDGSGLFDRGYNFEKGVFNENGESALKKKKNFFLLRRLMSRKVLVQINA